MLLSARAGVPDDIGAALPDGLVDLSVAAGVAVLVDGCVVVLSVVAGCCIGCADAGAGSLGVDVCA